MVSGWVGRGIILLQSEFIFTQTCLLLKFCMPSTCIHQMLKVIAQIGLQFLKIASKTEYEIIQENLSGRHLKQNIHLERNKPGISHGSNIILILQSDLVPSLTFYIETILC